MASVAVWFELPAIDLDRAAKFYRTVLGLDVRVQDFNGSPMGFFPMEGYDNSGALVKSEDFIPSAKAATVIFNGGADLSEPLSRVEGAGGKVLVPKTNIGEGMGYYALFLDSEGNRVGLHSMK